MNNNTRGDGTIVQFPATPEERRALRKAKQDLDRQRLIRCFVDDAWAKQALFHSSDGIGFADLIIEGARQTWPVRSEQFRIEYIRFLQRECDRLTDEGAVAALTLKSSLRKAAINAAIDDFELRAITSTIERDVHVRVAADGDELYIDIGDPHWHAVRVTATGWNIVQSPPVRFRRTRGMLALPFPERGASIDALRPFLNVRDENDFTLAVAWLLAAMRPRGPYPVLALYGEHGTAKTSFIRRLRSLIDPNLIMTSSLPSGGRDVFVAANNTHCSCFENVSKLPDRLSDVLCRLATGGGWRTRSLFKDADETLFRGGRPIALEGITSFISRGDLQDRAVVLSLDPLSGYQTESELNAAFEAQRAGIFGALLDRLARGLQMLPETRLAHPPRLADFAHWAVACGLDRFEAAYRENRQHAISVILEFDSLAGAVQALMAHAHEWRGTAQELLEVLDPAVRVGNARALSDRLRRIAPLLRAAGIDVQHAPRTATRREIKIFRR